MTENRFLGQEVRFHDQWASSIDVENINVTRYFHGSTCPENRFILKQLGNLQGKQILEIGCGAGENSVYFAMQGAQCVATDISSGMLQKTEALARKHGVHVETRQMDATKFDFPDERFDMVYGANVLHHVDVMQAIRESHRVLRKGGQACFWDPLVHNPMIKIYRHLATQVRTTDEHPLEMRLVKDVGRLFSRVEYDTFWLATLWLFMRFYLIEHVHPNQERYWKKIVIEEERLRPLYFALEKWDHRIKKYMPFLKRYAWNLAMVATK